MRLLAFLEALGDSKPGRGALIQEARELVNENQRLKTRVLELEQRLAIDSPSKVRVLEFETEVAELERRLALYQDKAELIKTVFIHQDFAYRDSDPIPHCLCCWDATGKLIHLFYRRGVGLQCPRCDRMFLGLDRHNPGRESPGSVSAR